MTTQTSVEFEWADRNSELEPLRESLSANGAQFEPGFQPFVPDDREKMDYTHAAFEPISMLVGTALLITIAHKVVDLVRDARYSGLIVDTRGSRLRIRANPALTRGTVLVIGPKGAQLFNSSKDVDIVTAVKALAPMLGGGPET